MKAGWIALIPAYQPADQLLPLLEEAKNNGFQLLVVDDGSNKDSGSIFESAARVGTVLHHVRNMGKGRAIKTGLSYIQKHYSSNCISGERYEYEMNVLLNCSCTGIPIFRVFSYRILEPGS